MKINLGFACTTKTLDITCSSLMTYTNYLKHQDLDKLHNMIKSNLEHLKKILIYNIKNDIKFFRLSSKIIPLATKDDVVFDYITPYQKEFKELSKLCKHLRVDFHPDQFTILNSTNKDVIKKAIENLEYHYKLLNALDIKDKILILHIGSSVFGKENSIVRFINTYNKLPNYLKECIAIENDDKIYTVTDTLYLANKLNIPFILDYHHHLCNNDSESLEKILPNIISTFNNKKVKMHFSSPKSKIKKEFRNHHDYINVNEFIKFIEILRPLNIDIDIMLEAKAKDEALFRLIRELKYLTNYKIEGTTIII